MKAGNHRYKSSRYVSFNESTPHCPPSATVSRSESPWSVTVMTLKTHTIQISPTNKIELKPHTQHGRAFQQRYPAQRSFH
jgi:hypothetical protein